MANQYRGERALSIGGKSYVVSFTLQALAEVSGALGVETMDEVRTRILAMKPTDMMPIVAALLRGNGHDVDQAAIARMPVDAFFDEVLPALFPSKDDGGDKADASKPSPRKRA